MLPHLQPHRPQIQQPATSLGPNTQIRKTSNLPKQILYSHPSFNSHPASYQQPSPPNPYRPHIQQQASQQPRSQIEAMPPTKPQSAFSQQQQQQQQQHQRQQDEQQRQPPPPPPGPPFVFHQNPAFDPARMHPAFFTQTLIKPPFPLPKQMGGRGGPGMANPVTFGYIDESWGMARRRDGVGGGAGTKL